MQEKAERKKSLNELVNHRFDLLVIGGGITGAGIALDAASRGMRVCLIEKYDFASGTSSKSTKLIHGGLRYLKQMEFGLVREVGMERAIIHRLAPHLVKPINMLLPVYKNGSLGKFTTAIALGVYDWLAKVKKEERFRMLKHSEVLQLEPLLAVHNLVGGAVYKEYQTDDARLTMAVIKTAQQFGAICLNYCKAEKLLFNQNRVCGAQVFDLDSNNSLQIQAQVVVNAGGPWVDVIRGEANDTNKYLHLTKGIHIVVPDKLFPVSQAVYFDTPQDGRMIFAIPRDRVVYIGTTDTSFLGEIDKPLVTEADVEYLINAVNAKFPSVHLQVSHVESSWAGLRPLIHQKGKAPGAISRKDEIFISPQNLISIAGGKLTGYRRMSQKVNDLVANQLKVNNAINISTCQTINLPLSGSNFKMPVNEYVERRAGEAKQIGFTKKEIEQLVFKYGTATEIIIENAFALHKFYAEEHMRKLAAELKYSVEYEMVMNLSDFLIRRTGMLYFNLPYVKTIYKDAAQILGTFLRLTDAEIEMQIQFFENAMHEAHTFT